jgi:hypothetical protein
MAGNTTQAELDELRFHWGDAYRIDYRLGQFRAERRDDGSAVRAATAEALLAEIRDDYAANPVGRVGHDCRLRPQG